MINNLNYKIEMVVRIEILVLIEAIILIEITMLIEVETKMLEIKILETIFVIVNNAIEMAKTISSKRTEHAN